MRILRNLSITLLALLIISFTASCDISGEFKELASGETVIGSVQATFEVNSTDFMTKKGIESIEIRAYIYLMEDAGDKFTSNIVDIRDITWVKGNSINGSTTAVATTGKVIKLD